MTKQKLHDTGATRAHFDRPCEHLAVKDAADSPWSVTQKRGDLDLAKDGSQHRRFHSLYEDLLN